MRRRSVVPGLRGRSRSMRGWWQTLERSALERAPGDIKQAQAAFRRLTPEDRMTLVRELVVARGHELTRAYADVVGVGAGYRLKRAGRARRRKVTGEACVRLIARRKWQKGARGVASRRLPAHLFTHATIDGARVLCAVPTDVDDSRRLRLVRPQGETIEASALGRGVKGVIACAITRGAEETVYAVGCRHVFGLAEVLDPSKNYAADIHLFTGGTSVGRATPLAGRLRNGPELSFDGHLARVSNTEALSAALGATAETRMQGWADLQPDVDYWILTPDEPVRARFAGHYTGPLEYSASLRDVRHFELAEFHLPDRATRKGTSGSPVMTERSGGALIGMHIAGDERDTSFAIPAWQLLHAAWYGISDEVWTLWPRQR